MQLSPLYRRRIPLVVFAVGLFAGTLWGAGRIAYRQGMDNLAEEGSYRLELYVAYLQGVLEKYEGLPELLATDKRLVNFLLHPGSRERVEVLNHYLETVNSISDAADTYLMDREGLTIAASNWQAERPFVGRNFSYRPYFQQAMQGRLGRYFALGTTSSRRGYYFAYPVRSEDEILGAVVIKINIDSVEHNWGHRDENFLVTDPDGVIFITTNPDWRFYSLNPLSSEVKIRIEKSKRYPHASLNPLGVRSTVSTDAGIVVSLQKNGTRQSFLQQSHSMAHAGWQVHILSDTRHVRNLVLRTFVGISAVFVLLALVLLMFWQRQQRIQDRIRLEEEARATLEQANAGLELRVSERTRALTESNRQLLVEIEDRKHTEEKLRLARSELIHTAKLAAIGQMATGINHELNQPLAAIRAYADNGREFLRKNRVKDALWNLDQIGELIERMARIGAQLKIFSRKTSGRLTCLPLHGIIDGALEIVTPLLRKTGVQVTISLVPEDIQLQTNSVLLQQALVNLISNGIQAVQGQSEMIVRVGGSYYDDFVRIEVFDNGPGLKGANVEKVFEPFYTTKPAGQGLGLGLTITRRIIEEMNGDIQVTSSGQGTCFVLLLQRGGKEHDPCMRKKEKYRRSREK